VAYTREQYNEFVENELTQQDRKSYWGAAVGVGLPATAFAVGFMRTKSGGRVWDVYFKALQHMEGSLPMGIGATFRLSEIISPLAAPAKFSLTPGDHPDLFKGRGIQDYLSKMTGRRAAELRELGVFTTGVEWTRTGATLGELRVAGGGPVLASNIAALSTGPRRTGHILEWFNRVTGVKNPTFLRRIQESEDYLRPSFLPIGAKGSAGKLTGKYLYAIASSGIGRMNLLLSSPYDLPIMEEMAKKVPILGKIQLGVKSGTGLQMLSRYAGKAAIGLGAYHGLKYADYLAREYGPAASIPMGAAMGATAGALFGFGRAKGSRYAAIGAAVGGLLGATLGGPISGAAEVYARGRVTQAEVSDTLGLRSGAERTEGFFPGLTKPTTLVASAGVGLLLGGVSDYFERLKVARSIGRSRKTVGTSGQRAKDVYEEAEGFVKAKREALYKSYGDVVEKEVGLKKLLAQVRQRFQGTMKGGKFSPGSAAGKGAIIGSAVFAGLSTAGTLLSGDLGGTLLTGLSSLGAAYAYAKKGPLAALGVLAAPLILREKEDPEKLKRIYAGQELVPVKAGRFWEAGRTPYEGGRPYFRQHRVAMMRAGGVQEQALYGDESAYWETDPVMSPLSWLADPYAREKLMWQQGYKFPVSKTPFEDFPILGPVLATTLGRAIKPPKFMGRDQWMPDPSTTKVPEGWEELPQEDPIMRTSLRGTVGEQMYRMTELMGLPGFALQSVKERLTGQESWFPNDQWATPSLVSGMEPGWWSLEMGGLAFLSEGIRRYIPHRRSDVEYRNPLPSGLPSWLPGPTSHYYLDFSRAEIYSQIKEPWARLPGKGFEALNPELKGVDPEEYPSYWRFKVLCLDRATRIPTSLGIKEIKDISPGDLVYGADGLPKKVLFSKSRAGVEQKCSIKTFYNEYPLVCSEDHKILVSDREGIVREISAKEVTKQDYLILPKLQGPLGEPSLCIGDYCNVDDTTLKYESGEYWAHVKGSQRWIRFNLPVDYSLGRVFGLYLAEGYSSSKSHQVVWTFHIREKDTYGEEIREFARFLGLSTHERILEDKHTYHVSINNKLLARFLRELFGHGAANKHIGFDVTKFSREFLLGLVDGYFDGDGNLCVQKTSITLRATSISRQLLEQFRFILALLGITSAIRERKGKYREYPGASQSWTLDIARRDIKCLPAYSKADFSKHQYRISSSHKFSFETERFVAFRVKEFCSEVDECSWFDLAIEDSGGSHCFVTTQGLVHNSDLAPWSQEYGQYDKAMSELKAQGRLTADQILQVQATRRQVKEAKRKREFQRLKYDEATTRQKVRITGEVGPGIYLTDSFGSAPITLAGVDSSGASLANIAMQENASLTAIEALREGQAKQAQLSDYLRDYLYPGAEIDVFVHKDPSSLMERGPGGQATVPVVAVAGGTNVNRRLIEMGLGHEEETLGALDPMAATGAIQRAFGSFWENLAHGAETPLESLTPVAPISKFVHQRTALEDYQRAQVYGRDVALWQKPVEHFIAPGLRTTMWWAGWKDLPADVKERYMVDEYFDRLKHMKWERLSDAARARGEGAAASQYMARAEKTITGANIFSERSAYLALGKNERIYFEQFVHSPSAREKREISEYVSPQMNRVLHAQWARKAAEGAQMRAEAGIPMTGDQEIMSGFNAMRSPEAEIARQREISQAQDEMPVPGPAWVGWQGTAAIDDFKVKTIHDKEMDISQYGIWDSDLERVERRPWVEPIGAAMESPARPVGNPGNIRRQFNRFLNRFGRRGPSTVLTADGYSRMNVHDDGRDRLDRYMRDPSILQF
jgi:hypothetical protein